MLARRFHPDPFEVAVTLCRSVISALITRPHKLAYEAVARVLHLLGLMPRVFCSFVG